MANFLLTTPQGNPTGNEAKWNTGSFGSTTTTGSVAKSAKEDMLRLSVDRIKWQGQIMHKIENSFRWGKFSAKLVGKHLFLNSKDTAGVNSDEVSICYRLTADCDPRIECAAQKDTIQLLVLFKGMMVSVDELASGKLGVISAEAMDGWHALKIVQGYNMHGMNIPAEARMEQLALFRALRVSSKIDTICDHQMQVINVEDIRSGGDVDNDGYVVIPDKNSSNVVYSSKHETMRAACVGRERYGLLETILSHEDPDKHFVEVLSSFLDTLTLSHANLLCFYSIAFLTNLEKGMEEPISECESYNEQIHSSTILGVQILCELCKGRTLQDYLDRMTASKTSTRARRTIASWRKAMVTGQLLQGMAYLHSKKVVHGKLCPANIGLLHDFDFVSRDDEGTTIVKIMNLGGLSGVPEVKSDYSTQKTLEHHDYRYRAPWEDFCHDDTYPGAPDMYSFSLIVYVMETLSIPFSHIRWSRELVKAVQGGERPSLTRVHSAKALQSMLVNCWTPRLSLRWKVKDTLAFWTFHKHEMFADDTDTALHEAPHRREDVYHKSGVWLKKRPEVVGRAKRRYFVLEGNQFRYYSREDTDGFGVDQKGSILLHMDAKVEVNGRILLIHGGIANSGFAYLGSLGVQDASRTWELEAASFDEAEFWAKRIKAAVNRISSINSVGAFYKIAILGDSGVGKSTIVHKLTHPNMPFENIQSMVGRRDIHSLKLADCTLELIDVPYGIEGMAHIPPSVCRDVHGCVLVYDITKPLTAHHLREWYQFLVNVLGVNRPPIVVLGNKVDEDWNQDSYERLECKRLVKLFVEWANGDVQDCELSPVVISVNEISCLDEINNNIFKRIGETLGEHLHERIGYVNKRSQGDLVDLSEGNEFPQDSNGCC